MVAPQESVVHGSEATGKAEPKDLPSIDRLLRQPAAAALVAEHGHTLVAGEARALLEALRARALAGELELSAVQPAPLQAALAARLGGPHWVQLMKG